MNTKVHNIRDSYTLEEAFPAVEPMEVPLGNRILFQIREPRSRLAGSNLILAAETRDNAKANEMVAKVIALGPVAFKNRDTLKPWPEGDWVNPGDYVRVPKWGGSREELGKPGEPGHTVFVIFNDYEVISKITGNPLEIKGGML
jgi:co-chaperonin GroES (HSP10)